MIKFRHVTKNYLEVIQDGHSVGQLRRGTESGWIFTGLDYSDDEELLSAIASKIKELNTYG